jgi:hypothetical protein
MVVNHTSRDWMTPAMGWPRYHLIYGSLLLPAMIFLFLAGFVLPIGYHRAPQPAGPTAARFFRRGIRIIAAGYLLNLLVIRSQPLWSGGVLQTIGLSIVVCGSLLPLMRYRWTRWALLVLAVGGYLAFAQAVAALTRWTAEHPVLGKALFNDFPPWPWLAAALLGLVAGWTWLDARAQGPVHEDRFFVGAAALGAALLLAWVAWEWWTPVTPQFGFARDFTLNRHWTPRGATTVLVLGALASLLVATHWLVERRGVEARWLVTLGRTALMLYFVHQLIELTLISELLGVRLDHWLLYAAANAVFVVLLVSLGHAWLEVKARWRARRFRDRDAPAPPRPTDDGSRTGRA